MCVSLLHLQFTKSSNTEVFLPYSAPQAVDACQPALLLVVFYTKLKIGQARTLNATSFSTEAFPLLRTGHHAATPAETSGQPPGTQRAFFDNSLSSLSSFAFRCSKKLERIHKENSFGKALAASEEPGAVPSYRVAVDCVLAQLWSVVSASGSRGHRILLQHGGSGHISPPQRRSYVSLAPCIETAE